MQKGKADLGRSYSQAWLQRVCQGTSRGRGSSNRHQAGWPEQRPNRSIPGHQGRWIQDRSHTDHWDVTTLTALKTPRGQEWLGIQRTPNSPDNGLTSLDLSYSLLLRCGRTIAIKFSTSRHHAGPYRTLTRRRAQPWICSGHTADSPPENHFSLCAPRTSYPGVVGEVPAPQREERLV